MIPTASPRRMVKLASRRTCFAPNRFETPWNSTSTSPRCDPPAAATAPGTAAAAALENRGGRGRARRPRPAAPAAPAPPAPRPPLAEAPALPASIPAPPAPSAPVCPSLPPRRGPRGDLPQAAPLPNLCQRGTPHRSSPGRGSRFSPLGGVLETFEAKGAGGGSSLAGFSLTIVASQGWLPGLLSSGAGHTGCELTAPQALLMSYIAKTGSP